MTVLRFPLILLLAGVLGLAGCSVHQPVSLYQLDSGTPAQPAQSSGMAVLLGPVLIADYLQRETLLQLSHCLLRRLSVICVDRLRRLSRFDTATVEARRANRHDIMTVVAVSPRLKASRQLRGNPTISQP